MSSTLHTSRGGMWLLLDRATDVPVTPETIDDEHRLVRQTAVEFVDQEVKPSLEALERKDWSRARALVTRAGDLGLLGADVPESAGGVGLDKVASILVADAIGACPSFSMTFGGQTNLSILPVLCFGTPDQQARYLPRLVAGEIVGAYCLSESGAGSDALSVRTRAMRASDGSWRLDGEKMWTTNGGFADLFVVFAKVSGEAFSAFLVERGFPGVSTGAEEHKMGLHGSSTTPVVLADAHVPAANLLGEVGRGHTIAFNVLNYGRFKLAATCTGGAREALADAAAYTATRRQFGQPLSSFGAIREKLARMASRLYAVESMLFRTAGWIDGAIAAGPAHDGSVIVRALEEFAMEASLLKIAGSEMIGFVVDENVQIHGGNGFVRDYAAERHYRDARVDRIFEGTNEINRLIVPAMLVKRAAAGRLPVVDAAHAAARAHAAVPSRRDDGLDAGRAIVAALKHTALATFGLALDRYQATLADEQEVASLLTNLVLAAFESDSAILRAERAAEARHPAAAIAADASLVTAEEAAARAEADARTIAASLAPGEARRTALAALDRTFARDPVDVIGARRRVADAVSAARRYPFD